MGSEQLKIPFIYLTYFKSSFGSFFVI